MNEANLALISRHDEFVVLRGFTAERLYTSGSASEAFGFAMAALAEGGKLSVGAGTFPLDSPVQLSSHQSLVGSGTATRFDVTDANTEGIAISACNADGVHVAELLVRPSTNGGGSTGIVLEGCGSSTVRDVVSGGFADYGVRACNETFLCNIESCKLPENGKAGLAMEHLREDSRTGNYVPNTVSGVTAYGGGIGFLLDNAIVANLVACTAFQTTESAYKLHKSNSIVITGSRSFQITGNAVSAVESHELNITGNIFCWHTGDGIHIDNCVWGTISGNDVIDTSSWNSERPDHDTKTNDLPAERDHHSAIILEGARGFTVGNNAIFNWEQGTRMHSGVIESASCYENIITGNTINFYQHDGLNLNGRDTIARSNISYKDAAYVGPPDDTYVQSFEPSRTASYIESLIYPERM